MDHIATGNHMKECSELCFFEFIFQSIENLHEINHVFFFYPLFIYYIHNNYVNYTLFLC